MSKLTYKAKAWNDTFPEVTKTQYLVMAFLLSWQDDGGVNATEIGMRVGEKPYGPNASGWARSILKALEAKGYAEMASKTWYRQVQVKWKLTLHGCLYLKNYPMPE